MQDEAPSGSSQPSAREKWTPQVYLRKTELRQWSLWAVAILITLLLTFAAGSLAFSLLRDEGEVFYFLNVHQAVYGLLGLLLLFDLYVIHQQRQTWQTHRQLNEQYELFRLIGESVADMIAVVDMDGRRLYNSPSYQRVLGYSAEELEGTASFEQIHPDDRPLVKEAAQEARRTGVGRKLEYRFRHKDGTWRILESMASVIRNDAGEPARMIIVNRDITERRQAEKELRENQLRQTQKMEALGRLSGGIAHDFNNLLGVIIGYTDVLEVPLIEEELRFKSVREIKKAGQRAASLTRQLLAFSRQQVLEPKVLDLNVVVADVEKMLRRVIGEDIELITRLGTSLGRVMADQGQIEQVIMNLAANARDAMPNGGRLTIETANVKLDETTVPQAPEARRGPYVLLSVSDSGIGMDTETQAHIFEPFFTTKERGRGTGLGLATVYGVVKQSNGYIEVSSEPAKGTQFKIYLPLVEGEVQATSPEVIEPQFAQNGETILLVEDEESLRCVTRDLLVQHGYDVIEADSGAQGLEIARHHQSSIHLMLTDVVMPGMNGPTLARNLAECHPETKVLFMSGYTDHTIDRHGVLEPGVLLLEKPYTREALTRKVRAALNAVAVSNCV
jgi:two-component system, cell cycle sensor histidine kinase and response regulator CckA